MKRQTLEESVYEAVRDSIMTGELRPGDPLVEAQLSADMGISKTPVREALIRLTRDGLVEQAAHRRSRVATPTVENVVEACELRRWVEGEIAAEASRRPSPDLLARLEGSIADSEEALRRSDPRAWAIAIEGFTGVLIEHSGNRYAAQLLERMRNVLSLIATLSEEAPGRRERSLDEHRSILAAIRAGDGESAREATWEHLRSIEADSLGALEDFTAAAG